MNGLQKTQIKGSAPSESKGQAHLKPIAEVKPGVSYLFFNRSVDIGQTLLTHSQEGLDNSPESHQVILRTNTHTESKTTAS